MGKNLKDGIGRERKWEKMRKIKRKGVGRERNTGKNRKNNEVNFILF